MGIEKYIKYLANNNPGYLEFLGMDEAVLNKNAIVKIVVNEKNGYTIVKFADDSISKVHCNGEKFDAEKAIAVAIAKHLLGSKQFFKAVENATIIKKEEK